MPQQLHQRDRRVGGQPGAVEQHLGAHARREFGRDGLGAAIEPGERARERPVARVEQHARLAHARAGDAGDLAARRDLRRQIAQAGAGRLPQRFRVVLGLAGADRDRGGGACGTGERAAARVGQQGAHALGAAIEPDQERPRAARNPHPPSPRRRKSSGSGTRGKSG